MIKNYMASISPFVGLNGFNPTSFIYSQVVTQLLLTAELFSRGCTVIMDRGAGTWANKDTVIHLFVLSAEM